MSKHRVAVLKVVTNQLSVTAAAAAYGLSRGHVGEHVSCRGIAPKRAEAIEVSRA
jgi:hypothetical protein